jgi:hypothetical protein
MTNEEAAIERARIAEADREKASIERNTTFKEKSEKEAARNSAKKQQRETATTAIQSGNINLQEIARQGGSFGRKIERELRRFETTGRVSNWLAGETIKAQSAQNAAQQSAFRQAVTDVISTSQIPLELRTGISIFPSLKEKIKINEEGGGSRPLPWDIYVIGTEGEETINTYKLKVQAGIVGGLLPTNWDEEFTADNNNVYFGKVVVSTDGTALISAEIVIDQEPPALLQPEAFAIQETAEFLFGLFSSGNRYNVVNGNSIPATPSQWLVVEKPEPAPVGESPFEIYYNLQ